MEWKKNRILAWSWQQQKKRYIGAKKNKKIKGLKCFLFLFTRVREFIHLFSIRGTSVGRESCGRISQSHLLPLMSSSCALIYLLFLYFSFFFSSHICITNATSYTEYMTTHNISHNFFKKIYVSYFYCKSSFIFITFYSIFLSSGFYHIFFIPYNHKALLSSDIFTDCLKTPL